MPVSVNTICVLCKNDNSKKQRDGNRNVDYYSCPICGTYGISRSLESIFNLEGSEYQRKAHLASGLARELTEAGATPPEFLTSNFDDLVANYPVPDTRSVKKKAEKLIEHLQNKSDYFGKKIALAYATDYSLAYAQNGQELDAIIDLLVSDNVISRENMLHKTMVVLTGKGWNLADSLQKANTESKQGFVAIWFNDAMNESIIAIEQAIADSGFMPLCIRGEHFKDKIMDKALGEIRKSRFIIVDLTGARSSVFFEAGFAFGLGVEAIYVYKEDSIEGLEFYVRHYQCYPYTSALDLREKLSAAISARIKN